MAKGFVIWLTGLSGAGKSTIAARLVQELDRLGRHVEVLDGDEVRTHLSKGLGFSKEDRDTNIRRIGYVAGLVARSGGVAITAAISPYREIRDEIREKTPNFVEVYVRCSIEELTRRDVKGLYAKALAGEIPHFTGISDPYEEPLHPEIVVDSGAETVEESTERILDRLEVLGHIGRGVREHLATGEELERLREVARALPSFDLDPRQVSDAGMLGVGALAPLQAFMGAADYAAVLASGRLQGGQPFTIPVVLRVHDDDVERLRGASQVALRSAGKPIAVLEVAEIFRTDPAVEAASVYGTDDVAHPGVRLLRSGGQWAIGGPVTALARPSTGFDEYDLTPLEVRRLSPSAAGAPPWASRPGTRCTAPTSTSRRWPSRTSTACSSTRWSGRRRATTSPPTCGWPATRPCSRVTTPSSASCWPPTRRGCGTRAPRRRSSTP